jgi:hypothetical protein
MPLDVADPGTTLASVFAPQTISSWNAATQKFENVAPLTAGSGVFGLSVSDQTLNVTGISRDITMSISIPLKPGWNLVGNPYSFGRFWNDETITLEKGGFETSITKASDLVYHQIWLAYDNTTGDYQKASSDPRVQVQPTAIPHSTGFWVLVFKECNMLISTTSAGPGDVPPLPMAPIINSPVVILDNITPPVPAIQSPERVTVTKMYQNYPNPFNPDTWVPYKLSKDAHVTIGVYDVRGNLVRELDLGNKPMGLYLTRDKAAHWDGRNSIGEKIASGLYFYQLKTSSGFKSPMKRMVILK